MKKIFLLALTLSTLSLSAQNHLIGIQGGLNLTGVSTTNFPSQGFRKGINAGLTYEYLFRNHVSIGVDFMYAQRGFTSTIPFINSNGYMTPPNSSSQFNYDYLSLPVKAGYQLGEKFHGFLNLGVVPSILVDAETIIENMNTGKSESYSQTDRVNKFDLAALLELGAGFKVKERYNFFASAGYQNSFISSTTDNYFSSTKMYHYGFTFSLGLKYSIGKNTATETSK